jgi:tRNA-uridine aminocarboxypropyltransferase
MKIHLLTHQKEYKRPSNTGTVVMDTLGESDVVKILWERKNPDKDLLDSIARGKAALLYKVFRDLKEPEEFEDRKVEDLTEIEDFIILDGTWQEAAKIYNKSPYLHGVKTFSFPSQNKSKYNIRRNQIKGGLCTAECVIELLKIIGETPKADKLHASFLEFLDLMVTRVVVLPSESSD